MTTFVYDHTRYANQPIVFELGIRAETLNATVVIENTKVSHVVISEIIIPALALVKANGNILPFNKESSEYPQVFKDYESLIDAFKDFCPYCMTSSLNIIEVFYLPIAAKIKLL